MTNETSIKLAPGVTIVDEKRFVEAHTATIERNAGNPVFEPYRQRLELYNVIKKIHEQSN